MGNGLVEQVWLDLKWSWGWIWNSGVGVRIGVGADILKICLSWSWSWNLRSWSWYSGHWPELELKPLELELILWSWPQPWIWVLVCINMYRYERYFGSFYHNPTRLETVSILSKWVNTDLMDRRFYWRYNDREKFYHPCVCVQVKCENQMKFFFSYNFPRWPVRVKSCHVVFKLLRNHLRPVNKTVPN